MRSLSWYEDVEQHSKYVVDSATSASVLCEAWNLRLPEALACTSCWRKVGILRNLKSRSAPTVSWIGGSDDTERFAASQRFPPPKSTASPGPGECSAQTGARLGKPGPGPAWQVRPCKES